MPAKILAVADIPRTMNGKIVELAVREAIHGRPVGNRDALANPQALELVRRPPGARLVTGPLAHYRRRVDRGEISADAAQARAVEALERLHRDLLRATPHRGWRGKVAKLAGKRSAPVRGLYLWGGVGRGKTFMMDLFFNTLPFPDKRRQHFHRFMATVHERLKATATSRTRSSSWRRKSRPTRASSASTSSP